MSLAESRSEALREKRKSSGRAHLALPLAAVAAIVGLLALSPTLPAESSIVGASGHVAPPTTPTNLKGPFAVILVVDAARADEFDPANMPNLAKLRAQGTVFTNAYVGQLPSVTESSHASIGTGVLPKRHLILGDTWRVPGTSQMSPNLLDGSLTRTGYIGKVIQQAKVPSIGGLVHQRYPNSRVVALSGHKIYAADALGAGTADYVAFGSKDARGHFVPFAIPGHEPVQKILTSPQLDLETYPRSPGVEDNWTTTLALKFLFKYHPRVMMINLPEVDVFGHLAGTNATIMEPLLSDVDHQIGRLVAAYGRAGILPQTNWIITSDHGMVPGSHLVTASAIKKIVVKAGGSPLYIGHGDDSEIWLKNLDAVPRVAQALSDAKIPDVAAVFARSPLGKYRLVSPISRLAYAQVKQSYADLLGTLNQGESPDVVLLYDENTMTMTPSFQQAGRKGDHGGASWGAQHIPLVLVGPNVKQGFVSNYPARLIDIAPTVETLLNIHPANQDGMPLTDAMVKVPAWIVPNPKRVLRQSTDVTALQDEAVLRPNLSAPVTKAHHR